MSKQKAAHRLQEKKQSLQSLKKRSGWPAQSRVPSQPCPVEHTLPLLNTAPVLRRHMRPGPRSPQRQLPWNSAPCNPNTAANGGELRQQIRNLKMGWLQSISMENTMKWNTRKWVRAGETVLSSARNGGASPSWQGPHSSAVMKANVLHQPLMRNGVLGRQEQTERTADVSLWKPFKEKNKPP